MEWHYLYSVKMYLSHDVASGSEITAPRGFGDLGRRAIYFQGSREHWLLFKGSWGASSWFWGSREPCQKEKKINEKPPFCLILFLISSPSGGDIPPDPPCKS